MEKKAGESVARPRLRSSLISLASTGMIASSLWALPASAEQAPEPTESLSATVSPHSEPIPDPSSAPSPELSSTPTPAPSPSLTPSSGEARPISQPTAVPDETARQFPTETPSPDVEELSATPRIVVVKESASIAAMRARAVEIGGEVEKTLVGAIDGFVVNLTDEQVERLQAESGIDYIENDVEVRIASTKFRSVTKTTTEDMGNIDDGSSEAYDLGFTINWYGVNYDQIIMNNNGGAVLNDGLGAFRSYSNIDLDTTTRPLILPLFTDLDSSGAGTGSLTYGRGTVPDGTGLSNPDSGADKVFWAEWTNVGEYPASGPKYTFQMLLIEGASGAVTVEFNYDVVGVANSQFNKTFEVGFANPGSSSGDVTIASFSESPVTVSQRLVTAREPATNPSGRWSYLVNSGGTPTPAPTPSPTDGIQTGAPWGLDRVDQRALPLSSTYSSPGNGSGVRAYIVDTGIRTSHSEFTGRTASGYTSISDGNGTNDCHGHGTHVASSVAGTTYGVAKGATVIPVRVLNCSGSGTTSSVVAGLNWILNNHNRSTPAVINMSLGGWGSKSLDEAVADLHDAGIPVVVAAGNDNADAINYSPAREPKAITVGATTSSDTRASFSNTGSRLDVFAPGQSIVGAWYTSSTATVTVSGTSMASPHVAGAAAVYLGLNPDASSSQVANAITGTATVNVITDPGGGSPNRLLFVGAFSAEGGSGSPPQPSPPQSSAPSGSASSGSGGEGTSGGGDASGGAWVSAISKSSGPLSGGETVTLYGFGLEGTQQILFGYLAAPTYSVREGREIDVVVPGSPNAGTVDIIVTIQGVIGTRTLRQAYTYDASAPAYVPPTPATARAPTEAEGSPPPSPRTEFVTFRSDSADLTPAIRRRLTALTEQFTQPAVNATVVTFSDRRESPPSVRIATERAQNIKEFLEESGYEGTLSTAVRPASTPLQERGALIYVDPAASTPGASDQVSSLIVRLKQGRSITVRGEIRGANRVTGGIGETLTVGPYLGFRMYRIDFAEPVSSVVAERVARQMSNDPGIAFVEPDSIVSTQVSVTA